MEKYSAPIPNTAHAIRLKEKPVSYRQHPLHANDLRNEEELVRADEYGLKGISYYARKNAMTGEPIEGARPEVWLRKTVAQKLAAINHILETDPSIQKQYGQQLRLWISEGFRDVRVQNYIHDEWFPAWYRKNHPGKNEEALQTARAAFIARGTEPGEDVDALSPPPHYTGGAVDLKLEGIDGASLEFGHQSGRHGEIDTTDFYEKIPEAIITEQQKQARANRRLLYWLMLRQDFASNPHEWWHFSLGDQLWARLSNEPFAYYAIPPNVPEMDIKIQLKSK